ncbi:hypothetical protein [Neisseria sp. Ec49-e6-T10]|uniref:hypothetical protein n=1 Tax=Neisseria sp. Ec49-e6-T10 TaxID=3140744 RepID=UPI003EBF76AD
METQKSKVTQQDGMALAYYGYYESRKIKEAYDQDNQKERPTFNMPDKWGFMDDVRLDRLGLEKDFNVYRNSKGDVSNQFELLINDDTKEIVISFKGSVQLENWVSDLKNSGAGEFKKIQEKAQAALEKLQQHPIFKDYNISAAGHSLGGGMAQAFALKNNLDVHVYNSLPLTQGMIDAGYYDHDGKTGNAAYEAKLAQYDASNHTINDVRTANDIASQSIGYNILPGSKAHIFSSTDHSGYLSQNPTVLPGTPMPKALQIPLLVPMLMPMGLDHTMGSLRDATVNLSLNNNGQYILPKGQKSLAMMSASSRSILAALDDSPIYEVKASAFNQASKDFPKTWDIIRENNTHQSITVHERGETTIKQYNSDNTITEVGFNSWAIQRALNKNQGFELTMRHTDMEGKSIADSTLGTLSGQDAFGRTQVHTQNERTAPSIVIDPLNLNAQQQHAELKAMNPYLAQLATQLNDAPLESIKVSLNDTFDKKENHKVWVLNYEDGSSTRINSDNHMASIRMTHADGSRASIDNIGIRTLKQSIEKGEPLSLEVKNYGVHGKEIRPSTIELMQKDPTLAVDAQTKELKDRPSGDPEIDKLFAALKDPNALKGVVAELKASPMGQNFAEEVQKGVEQKMAEQQQQINQQQQEMTKQSRAMSR